MSDLVGKRVLELQDIIMKAENKLAEIRAKCTHPTYHVALWSWRIGNIEPSRICSICQHAIPGITEEETKSVDWVGNKDFDYENEEIILPTCRADICGDEE